MIIIASMLPQVDFCGLHLSRLVIGANPFGGFSHQNPERDREMVQFYTTERIIETWKRARAAGINAMVTNNESPLVVEAVKQYFAMDSELLWIAQVNHRLKTMQESIQEVVNMGCKALYFHGGVVDEIYRQKDAALLTSWCEFASSFGVPVGVAGHDPEVHLWVDQLGVVDFHAVCFFNCGSLHSGKGERFRLSDIQKAVEAIRKIHKPCIAYKIMGAGRIDARLAFEFAFEQIKPGDIVNVGMYRGDRDDMVEENARLVLEILSEPAIQPI